jgi:hypothetical protein
LALLKHREEDEAENRVIRALEVTPKMEITRLRLIMNLLSLALLALVSSSSAQYFSAGWNPGQKQPETQSQAEPTTNPSPIAEPVKITPLSLLKSFDINKILTSTPSVALFNRFGINITEKIEASLLSNIWDQRVPLISDDNYDDLVINEIMTEQEEIDRVWIIVVYVSSSSSPFFD